MDDSDYEDVVMDDEFTEFNIEESEFLPVQKKGVSKKKQVGRPKSTYEP